MNIIEEMQSYSGSVKAVGETTYIIRVNEEKAVEGDILPLFVVRDNPNERQCYSLIDVSQKMLEQMPDRIIERVIFAADRGYLRLLKTEPK